MKSIFNNNDYTELTKRIQALSPDTKPLWGKMKVAQMLAHATIPIEAALGIRNIPGKGNIILKLFFKTLLYSDKPYGKNSPTNKHFIVTDERDFEIEKNNLLSALEQARQKGLHGKWNIHPTFGEFSPEQWGMNFYKHTDHHLKQFGK